MLINGLDAHPKRVLSGDVVDDQFLDRSCVIFPGSWVVGSQGHVLISHVMYKWRRGHVMSHVQGHVICSHGHVVLELWVCS